MTDLIESQSPAPPPPSGDTLSILNIRNILTIAMVGFAIWLMFVLRSVIALFVSSIVIAFLMYPIVVWLEGVPLGKWRIPRGVAVLIVYLVAFAIVTMVFILLANLIRDQVDALLAAIESQMLQQKIEEMKFWVQENEALLQRFSLSSADLIRDIDEWFVTASTDGLETAGEWLADNLNVGRIFGGLSNALAVLIAMPILVFYMITDAQPIRKTLMGFIPPAFVSHTEGFLDALERTLNNYLRGQIKLGLWIFAIDSVLLVLIVPSLDSWLILAIIAGITEIIPVVGPTLALIVALIVTAIETGGDPTMLLWVAGIFTAVQMVENQILVPRIMGKQLDVHPLTVMFFLMAGGLLGGIVGALLSLPVAATLKVTFQQYYPTFIRRVQALLTDQSDVVVVE